MGYDGVSRGLVHGLDSTAPEPAAFMSGHGRQQKRYLALEALQALSKALGCLGVAPGPRPTPSPNRRSAVAFLALLHCAVPPGGPSAPQRDALERPYTAGGGGVPPP